MLIIQPKQDADIIDYLAKYIICMVEHREVFNVHGEFVNKKSPGFPTIEVDGTTLFGQMYSMTIYTSRAQNHDTLGKNLQLAIQKLVNLHDIKMLSGHKMISGGGNSFTQSFQPYFDGSLQLILSTIHAHDNKLCLSFSRGSPKQKARNNRSFEEHDFDIVFEQISKYNFKKQTIFPNVNGVFIDSDLILSISDHPKVQLEHTDDTLSVFKTSTIENKMLKMYPQIIFNEDVILHDFWNFIDVDALNLGRDKNTSSKIIEMSLLSGRVFRYPSDIKKCVEFASFIKPNCFICASRLYGECYFMVELYHDYGKMEPSTEKVEKMKAAKPKFAYRGFSACKVCTHSVETPRKALNKTNFCIIYDTEVKFSDVLDSLKCSAEKLKILRELNTIFEGGVKNLKSISDEKNYIVTPSYILVPNLIESLAMVRPDTTRKIITYRVL
jgi:hypothetical protein